MAAASFFEFRYPLTKLDSRDDYLKISFLEYIPPGFSQSGFAAPSSDDTYGLTDPKNIKLPSATAILPIPDDIRTSNTAQWGASSLNPLQAVALDLAQQGITDADPTGTWVGFVFSFYYNPFDVTHNIIDNFVCAIFYATTTWFLHLTETNYGT